MPFATAPDGAYLYYEVIGDGAPVLLVAGQSQDRTPWTGVRDDVAARHRVIVFDHRGTGDSDKPEAPYSTRGFAADAIAILDELGIARAHVYGTSMGGRIAQWMAIDHPARVGALVLGCTTPGNVHGVRRPPEVDPVLASGDPLRMRPYLVSDEWAQANRAFLVDIDAQQRARPVPVFARRLHYLASEGHDTWDLLPSIAAPTLLIHGTADLVNVAENSERLAGRIAGSELWLIPGGRHAYFWEYRTECAERLLAFFARHPIS